MEEKELQLTDMEESTLPVISLEGSEIVRRQYLSHIKENIVTIRPNGIQFNNSCIMRMEGVTHIHLIMNRSKKWLIIRGCDEDDRDGQRWCIANEGKRKSRMINGSDYSERVYKMMDWSKGYYYKICGTVAVQADSRDTLLLVFDLSEAEIYPMTAKSREAAGVIDEDLDQNELDKLTQIEEQRKKEKEERAAAVAAGEKVKRRRKRDRFPEVWGQESFGVPVEEHISKVVIDHLPDDINEAEQIVLGLFGKESENS